MFIKVQLFWEGHKNLCNFPQVFDIYLVNIKTLRKIAQIFVAFSEKLNFTKKNVARWTPNPLLICTWIMKNQVGKIKFDELDFLSISNRIFTACVACKSQFWNWFLQVKNPVSSLSNLTFQKSCTDG